MSANRQRRKARPWPITMVSCLEPIPQLRPTYTDSTACHAAGTAAEQQSRKPDDDSNRYRGRFLAPAASATGSSQHSRIHQGLVWLECLDLHACLVPGLDFHLLQVHCTTSVYLRQLPVESVFSDASADRVVCVLLSSPGKQAKTMRFEGQFLLTILLRSCWTVYAAER